MRTHANNLLRAFVFAFSGLKYFLRYERNGRIQAGIAVLTILAGVILKINRIEWIMVLLCIAGVLAAEMINSALEKLCDHVQPSFHTNIGIIKDMAAGAVLLLALVSTLIAAIIFLPKLWRL